MNRSKIGAALVALSPLMLVPPFADAGQNVPELKDLVGAKGAGGEAQLEQRGYTLIQVREGKTAKDMYWREAGSKRCVRVHLADGRYSSLVYTKDSDCVKPAANAAPKSPGFPTVCGVTVENKPYRWKCTVEGAPAGGPGETVVHYPDQKITLQWRGGDRVGVIFEGMNVQELTFINTEGVTQWTFEGKPYFYTSDPGAAAMEVKNFQGK